MSETIRELETPQQRVFSDVFELPKPSYSKHHPENLDIYYESRGDSIYVKGEVCWLVRDLRDQYDENGEAELKLNQGDDRVVADLYKDRRVIATLEFCHNTRLANVYVTSPGGPSNDTLVCDDVSFDEAVIEAEYFAMMTDNHPQLF